MTPKEKAKELVERYDFISTHDGLDIMDEELTMLDRKQCALIAVDEIMYNNLMEYPQHSIIYAPHKNDYWQEVKQEIENL
jgi:uncharacterized protein YajQ (UPF0234 family)